MRRRAHSRARANHVAGVEPEDARRLLRAVTYNEDSNMYHLQNEHTRYTFLDEKVPYRN